MLLSIDQINESKERYESYKNISSEKEFSNISKEEITYTIDDSISEEVAKGNIIGDEENLHKRKQMIESFGREPSEFAFERAIGKNDSVYSNFIELLSDAKRKVGRIVVKQGADIMGYATGFMVSEDLLMTNWHVFKTKESVANSVVQFFYELDTFGNPTSNVTFKLNSQAFFYSFEQLDYCLVAVNKNDVTDSHNLNSIGFIYLDPAFGKLGNENEELLNIIHHPNGDYKQLSIRENKFTKILPTTLWYESDTSQGSSGSPVFNDQWQVVALHHMGVAKKKNGKYVDKNDVPIPIVNNNIDSSKIHWIANEGIRISVIKKDLFSKFPNSPYILELKRPSPKVIEIETPVLIDDNESKGENNMKLNSDLVHMSFPSSLLEKQKNLNINFTIDGVTAQKEIISSDVTSENSNDNIGIEIKKLEKSTDYSACKGYQSNFLGPTFNIELPRPQTEIQKFISKITSTDSIILNYYKFSVIYHSVRRMPLISAINIDGDINKRKDKTERKDKWIRDKRIDFNVQLSDSYYKKSGFDRGHMSRREDANWGITAENAKRNADLTCVYTNACPQVPALNRSNHSGIWGKLEKIVLEKGAIKEGDATGKISVFSGPIFKDSDPIFRGIQIPTEYYKVVLWLSDDQKLKVTAFKLSQIELLDDIDLEAIDIDQNIEFKEYQCSLKLLQESTKIDFSKLLQFDTFVGNKNKLVEIISEEFLSDHLEKK